MLPVNNTVAAVLDRYQRDLGALHPPGEVRAIASAVFFDRLGWDAMELSEHRHALLSESDLLRVCSPLDRLRTGEPLQYVLGTTGFHGLILGVDPRVLIPRPETEEMVERIVQGSPAPPSRVIDIGTGSGCIALALKKAFPAANVTGIDVSDAALRCAESNALRNALDVTWLQADILDDRAQLPACDLIVSNPPYVPRHEESALDVHVRDHEPALALFVDDADPLLFYRAIIDKASAALVTDGSLWFEAHRDHAVAVADLLRGRGFHQVTLHKDLSDAPRSISARR